MSITWLPRILVVCLLGFGLACTTHGQQADDLDHRDDFEMNSISGGDFRAYISENIHEEDRWAHAMRTFGTFHNHMHEMMSELARYAVEGLGDGDRVPEFDDRISGGEWGDYREALEEDGAESAWRDFVQVTEIMHDRVHHAMYKSTVYDLISRDRDVDLGEYVPEDRAPHATEETIPGADDVRMEYASPEAFRTLAWHYDFEHPHLHNAMQLMMTFNALLFALMDQWVLYGAEMQDEACRPPAFEGRITGPDWQAYAERVADCDDEAWREFVVVTGLMHDRIHHMMYRMMRYDAEAHDRHDDIERLLAAMPARAR